MLKPAAVISILQSAALLDRWLSRFKVSNAPASVCPWLGIPSSMNVDYVLSILIDTKAQSSASLLTCAALHKVHTAKLLDCV